MNKKNNVAGIIALAGNPNVGKSTVFNALTGMRQHTGNWPGKTVALAQGRCQHQGVAYTLVDLPGCYSLNARSGDEEVARDFILGEKPDAVIVVCDASCLERNLILALQILTVTPRVILCVNLIDEAERKKITVNSCVLSDKLGVPTVSTAARTGRGLDRLMACAAYVASDAYDGEKLNAYDESETTTDLFENTRRYAETAAAICREAVCFNDARCYEKDRRLDRFFTGRWTAFPVMLLALAVIFWITLSGANYPSQWIGNVLFGWEPHIVNFLAWVGLPPFACSMLAHGAYRVLAWVVSVMLPPMALFFPLFTLLEDSGYLPRVAFNLDRVFQRCGACGKQSLTMCMGFGCNAAGVTGCRIIDSPCERLIAIITNSFVPCNGRFPPPRFEQLNYSLRLINGYEREMDRGV